MKRVATHRVFRLTECCEASALLEKESSCLVVEWDNATSRIEVYPLSDEIYATEWLPGIIILSPFIVAKKIGETFSAFVERLCVEYRQNIGTVSEMPSSAFMEKIYWISPFNVSAMEFLSDSRIVCLYS